MESQEKMTETEQVQPPATDDAGWREVRNVHGILRCRIHTSTGRVYLEFARRVGQVDERREVISLPAHIETEAVPVGY